MRLLKQSAIERMKNSQIKLALATELECSFSAVDNWVRNTKQKQLTRPKVLIAISKLLQEPLEELTTEA